MRIDPYGEADPVFQQEGFKRRRSHRRMMLEHRVEADNRNVATLVRFRLRFSFGIVQKLAKHTILVL